MDNIETTKTNLEIAVKYCNDILISIIPSCKYTKQACKMFLDNLDREDLYYNSKEVDKMIVFIESLELINVDKPKLFFLEPWQKFILCSIFGLYRKSNDRRRTQTAQIWLPRKNGKSLFACSILMYFLIFDVEQKIIICANSREQIKEVDLDTLKKLSLQLDKTNKTIKSQFNKIIYKKNQILAVANDASKGDGSNNSVVLFDEIHANKNSDMYDVLTSSQGSRNQRLKIIISTSGLNTNYFGYSLYDYSCKVLKGEIEDDSQFNIIYGIDKDDVWDSDISIQKANPNIGVSIDAEYIRTEINSALHNSTLLNSVKSKHLNIWPSSSNEGEQYINSELLNKCFDKEIKITDDKFKECQCFVGCDLANVRDLLAVTYMFVIEDKYYFFNRAYLPEENRNSLETNKLYKLWHKQGYIKLISGNVIDYQDVIDDMKEISEKYGFSLVSYDPAQAAQFCILGGNEGFNMQPFSQSYVSMNKPIKELMRLIYLEKAIIEYSPVVKWCFSNAYTKESHELLHVIKNNNNSKIDIVISMITCLGGYLNSPNYQFNIW